MTAYSRHRLKTTRGSALGVIVHRAAKLAAAAGVPFDKKFTLRMLAHVDEAVVPLRVTDLAKASDANLAHDVFGLMRHYNPSTGKLGPFFPRYGKERV